jgi:uncharacterized protein YkwD
MQANPKCWWHWVCLIKRMKFLLSLLFIAGLAALSHANAGSFAVLEEINLARVNPQRYAQLLSERAQETRIANSRSVAEAVSFLQKAKPLPPLSLAEGLSLSAQMHVNEQGARGSIGHGNPWSRIAAQGHYIGRAGENISYGYSDARSIVAQLIIDQGVPGRGHRKNIFNSGYAVAGVACGRHVRFGSMCVIDFAGGFEERGTTVALWTADRARFSGN